MGIAQGLHGGGVEPGDDLLGRAPGRPQAIPDADVERWQAGFGYGRDLGRRRQACIGRDGVGADLAVAHVLERIRCLVDDEIDLTGHQILQCRAGAAIRDELEAGAGDVLKIDARDMGRGPCTRRSGRDLALVRFDPADELVEVLRRDAVLADHDHRVAGQQHDRLEIAQQIVGQRVNRAVDHMRAPVAGAARATRPTPIEPAAPVTFSTMMLWPSETRIGSDRMRATVSTGPPAANGTTIVIGRDG